MYSACYGRPGKCAKETKKTPNFSGERGEEREAEDRERGVGDRIFPDQFNPEERR